MISKNNYEYLLKLYMLYGLNGIPQDKMYKLNPPEDIVYNCYKVYYYYDTNNNTQYQFKEKFIELIDNPPKFN